MAGLDLPTFLREYSEALAKGTAALFAGAGLSRQSGYVDWAGLLEDLASEIGLVIRLEPDLPAVAQYHLNRNRTRAAINDAIVSRFAQGGEHSESHEIVARLPLHSYWTTNYDTLIEESLANAGRRPDVKRSYQSLALSPPGADAVVYKMHGDVTAPHDAIVTKEDYETYDSTGRNLFTTALQGELVSKTFLFVGFSFSDPHVEAVLARIRRILGDNPRRHFAIIRRPQRGSEPEDDFNYALRRFALRVEDLVRYSIHAVIVDDYAEIPLILRELLRLHRAWTVFMSGAAVDFSPLGQERVRALCRTLGNRLLEQGYTIISGYGLGVGDAVALGAAEAIERDRVGIKAEQLRFRPFPQSIPADVDKTRLYSEHRRRLLMDAGIAVFLSGNRTNPETGSLEDSPGMKEEFSLALEQGAIPIPVGATGHSASRLWNEVSREPRRFFGELPVEEPLRVLGDPRSSNDQLIGAIFAIISEERRPQPLHR